MVEPGVVWKGAAVPARESAFDLSMNRRTFLTGVGAAAAAGSVAAVGVAAPVGATNGASNFGGKPAPKPIPQVIDTAEPGFVPPDPFRFIHWMLPGPEGSATQILGLPGFGLDVDPSLITDYHGFTAYAVLAGSARDTTGAMYDTELDLRVMQGEYIGEDGGTHYGTFGFF